MNYVRVVNLVVGVFLFFFVFVFVFFVCEMCADAAAVTCCE